MEAGEIISVLGPSGCGKSTLLNIIAGILSLDEGTVVIHGKEVSSAKKTVAIEARNINMVFQDFALWPHMKAKDNILYGLRVKKEEKDEMQKRLEEVLAHPEQTQKAHQEKFGGSGRSFASGGTDGTVPVRIVRGSAAESGDRACPDHETFDHTVR